MVSRLLLAAIVAIGVILRLRGIAFGLPAVYNPDEIAIMSRALAFAKGDLNPHNFLYPTFYFYVLFAWIGAFFVMGRVTGLFASAAAFEQQFFIDPSSVYLAGRVLGVVCGALTIVAVYLLARRLFDRTVALCAAASMAIAPYAVRDAHYVKHDVPVTLLIVLAYVVFARAAETTSGVDFHSVPRKSTPDVVFPSGVVSPAAAALCGLACSTHYYAVFLALPLLWTLWITAAGDVRRFARAATIAAGVAAATFFVASPFILAEPGTAVRDVLANRAIVVDRAVTSGGGAFSSAGAYARMLWHEAVGWPVLVASAIGVWLVVIKSMRIAVLLLSFPIAFLAFISNTVAAGRYLNPVIPFIALFAGIAIVACARAMAPRAPIAIAALMIVVSAPALSQSVRTGSFFRQTDTRTLALEFIESTIAPGSTIALQPYSTPLRPSRDSLREGLAAHGLTTPADIPTKFARQLALDPYPSPSYRVIYIGDGGLDQDRLYVGYGAFAEPRRLAALRQLGVQYVVVKRYNRPDPATLPFLNALASEGVRLAVFSPFASGAAERDAATVEPYLHNTDTPLHPALERPGPVIEIWKLS
jgi:hypothetical protein